MSAAICVVRQSLVVAVGIVMVLLLSACGTRELHDGPPLHQVDIHQIPNAVPKYEPKSRYGNPKSYVALGKRYYILNSTKGYDQRGIASWYGTKFHGQLTSSREPYDMLAMTAASPVLPIPCYVQVTNLENHRSVIVRVNDRGPFAPNRIIDLSYVAAKKLGYAQKGTALVEVKAINPRQLHSPLTPSVAADYPPQLYLQVGAFVDYNHATILKQKLASYTNKPIVIVQSPWHNQTIYRVRIGPLISVSESDNLFNQLHQHGLDDAVTVIS